MHNIDQQEVKKFDDLATHWWNPDGPLKTLHDINPLRLGFITQIINLHNKKVLDVGCGGGILSEAMAAQGAQVTGIDMSAQALQAAQQHQYQNSNKVDYQHKTVEQLAQQQAGKFDVVTCLELLEHVPEPNAIVEACSELVKPGGYIFFSTINRNLKAYIKAILGAEYILRMLPTGTHDYDKFIRPSELLQWARESHLSIQQLKGMDYNLLSKEYSLTDDISVNYLAALQK